MIVLTLQAGPSCLEYRLWDMVGERTLVDGRIEPIGEGAIHTYEYWFGSGQGSSDAPSPAEAFHRMWEALAISLPSIERVEGILPRIEGVGHVLPFVPPDGATSVRLTDALLSSLGPGSGPVNGQPGTGRAALDVLEEARGVMPEAVHVGVFDDLASLAAVPETACYAVRPPWSPEELVRRLASGGVRIRGILETALDLVGTVNGSPRIVICDLDPVPQVTSLKARSVIDTTHELDATSRLISETGPGAVSPGLRSTLMASGAPSAGAVDDLLASGSGLGCIEDDVENLSDVAVLAENQVYGPASRLFLDQVVREIGGQVTLLGGLDMLIFTGRTGFRSHALRSMIAARLRLFRVSVDESLNRAVQGPADIASEDSRIRVLVVPPASLWQTALETAHLLSDDV